MGHKSSQRGKITHNYFAIKTFSLLPKLSFERRKGIHPNSNKRCPQTRFRFYGRLRKGGFVHPETSFITLSNCLLRKKQRHLIGSPQCYNLHKTGLLIFNCLLTGYASLLIVMFLSAKNLAFDCIKNHKCIYQEPNLDLIAT